MKPGNFSYLRPNNVKEALDCLDDYGERARILAGGLSLGAMINYRLVDVEVLIDISDLKELSYIRRDGAACLARAVGNAAAPWVRPAQCRSLPDAQPWHGVW